MVNLKRRDFLKLSSGICLFPLSSYAQIVKEIPPDIKITRVIGFDLRCQRNKIAGKNAVRNVHGSQAREQMIRIFTNAGIDGIGHCRANEKTAAKILNKKLKTLLERPAGTYFRQILPRK